MLSKIAVFFTAPQGELGERLKGDVYLDYAAAGLYTNTQIDAHAKDLKEKLYGNPHSLSSLAKRVFLRVDVGVGSEFSEMSFE